MATKEQINKWIDERIESIPQEECNSQIKEEALDILKSIKRELEE